MVSRLEVVPFLFRSIDVGCLVLAAGPVFVEMPIDTLYEYKTVQSELGAQSTGPPKSLSQRLVNWYALKDVLRLRMTYLGNFLL